MSPHGIRFTLVSPVLVMSPLVSPFLVMSPLVSPPWRQEAWDRHQVATLVKSSI